MPWLRAASRGIGLAIAQSFAAAGADVAICARQPAALDAAAASLKSFGHRVSARACDLAQADEVRRWVEAAAQDLGGIDILVNNASGFGRTDDEAGWAVSRAGRPDGGGTRLSCGIAASGAQGGSIIHISSIAGMRASVARRPMARSRPR